MAWLLGQLWLLLILAFIIGAGAAWLVARITLPHVDEVGIDRSLEGRR